MSRSNMLHFQQYLVDDFVGSEQWCFEQGSSSKRDPRRSSTHRTTTQRKQAREQRELEKNLVKVRDEWKKVTEEMGYVKQQGEHLSEKLMAIDRKMKVMLVDLERTDKYVRDLMAQNDRV